MKTSLVLIIKTKTCDSSDKNNDQPIALVTVTIKLFEICILEIFENVPRNNIFYFYLYNIY